MSVKTPVAAVLVTSASLAAAGTTRFAYDCRNIDVATITARVTNGATPPGVAIQYNVYVAHTTGAVPATAAEGTTDTGWKRYMSRTGDIVADSTYRFVTEIPPSVSHIMVEFTGHTTQPVTIEAHLSAASYD